MLIIYQSYWCKMASWHMINIGISFPHMLMASNSLGKVLKTHHDTMVDWWLTSFDRPTWGNRKRDWEEGQVRETMGKRTPKWAVEAWKLHENPRKTWMGVPLSFEKPSYFIILVVHHRSIIDRYIHFSHWVGIMLVGGRMWWGHWPKSVKSSGCSRQAISSAPIRDHIEIEEMIVRHAMWLCQSLTASHISKGSGELPEFPLA